MSLIIVNFSEIFLGGMMLKVPSGSGFKDIGWRRSSSIDMGREVVIGEM